MNKWLVRLWVSVLFFGLILAMVLIAQLINAKFDEVIQECRLYTIDIGTLDVPEVENIKP